MKIKYKESISWQKVGDTVFVFNELNGQICCLNDVASDFWMQIEISDCQDIIYKNLKKIYGDVEGLKNDLEDFFEMLYEQNLIVKEV